MNNNKIITGIISVATVFALTACSGNDTPTTQESQGDSTTNTEMNNDTSSSHHGMNHSGSGEVPTDLTVAENPKYPVGSQAVIHADHMEGMDGAVATIAGAYNTTVYTVSYTPTTGGKKVENHKWVIHEEIDNHHHESYKAGDEVTLNADHMEGMHGAHTTIDSAETTTVYMVNYKDTKTGEEVMNHKWLTEEELAPVK
ncbi:YdhK family protein [Paenibacillus dakarensis]|uniref:YdhK family protein n=1 Tax=Paenibacillus dakarensis TaxID=1527293 RepID=UPI0006D54A2E|nr:YdhK family protein [Paenibacillus dakarensis]